MKLLEKIEQFLTKTIEYNTKEVIIFLIIYFSLGYIITISSFFNKCFFILVNYKSYCIINTINNIRNEI